MSSEHTPGPWWIDEIDTGTFEVIGKGSSLVAPIVTTAYFDNPSDARLIAAAPELLEALEALTTIIPDALVLSDEKPYFDAAHAAIAKAKGEAQ